MRDVAESLVGWLIPVGIVAAVVLARRRYRDKYSTDVAAARAEGYAAAKVELGVSQQVAVNVGNDARAADHQCADPWSCALCAPVLFRVLRSGRRDPAAVSRAYLGEPAGIHYDDDNEHDDHNNHSGRLDGRTDFVAGELIRDHRGRGAGDRGPAGDGADRGRVEGVPCASLSPTAAARRPVLATDMLNRPWAYDPADPRFEGLSDAG